MLNWLFGGDELPEGYEIRSYVGYLDKTYYDLYFGDKKIAHEWTYMSSHKTCLKKLRKAARLYAKNKVVPR